MRSKILGSYMWVFTVVNFMEDFSDSTSDSIPFNFDLKSSFSFLSVFITDTRN